MWNRDQKSWVHFSRCLDEMTKAMYGSRPAILFISHLTSSLFSWNPCKDVNVVFTLDMIEAISLNFRQRGFFILSNFYILKKKGSPVKVFLKICFRYKMMVSVTNLLKSFTAPELPALHFILSHLTEAAIWWVPMNGGKTGFHHFRWMKGLTSDAGLASFTLHSFYFLSDNYKDIN